MYYIINLYKESIIGGNGMKNHIIPKVLLKGYAFNEKENRIKFLEKDEIKDGNISNLFQIREYYNDETEFILNQQFESDYGRIRKIIIESELEKNKEKVILSSKEYNHLIRFYTIMWRRNDENYNNNKILLKNIIKSQIDLGLLPSNFNLEDAVDNIEIQHQLFENMAKLTKPNDPVIIRTMSWYKPYLIFNESDISFPLHSKIGTINKFDTEDPLFPRMLMEPVTKNILLLLILNENVKQNNINNKAINKIYLDDRNMIELIIKFYIVRTSTKVVVDDSNIEFIRYVLSNDIENIQLKNYSGNFRKFFEMIELI
jgi:hypothetical protein